MTILGSEDEPGIERVKLLVDQPIDMSIREILSEEEARAVIGL